MKPLKTAAELRAAVAGTAPPRSCSCALGACDGWESLAEYRWEEAQMTRVATLHDTDIDEPMLEEFHPGGTRYDSPQAPVAVSFFPYNRCDVWHCGRCDRHLLRYIEFGGYNVDPRVRALDPTKIMD
ncbi:MAG: hypothetical protein M3Q12_09575 [Pseudomonadota bacterium]|uniref:hypothetical protein n=1 Tax=Polaromonas sp. TaxID=1869339 RepID=UPI00178EC371|nr:hypothetical protein [Polaromonas sp.]MBA3592854.1 hypothetical protein [Polaromonas sp.]MDQ3272397.1 hypothetical protein [Pseudomonadota bacterium]